MSFWESAFLWRDALIAMTFLAPLLAYLGFYVVLTRNAFVSITISQLAALGIVVAILLELTDSGPLILLFALILGMMTTVFFFMPAGKKLPADSLLAILFLAANGLMLVLSSKLTTDYQHLQAALYGDIVVAHPTEVYFLALFVVLMALFYWRLQARFWFILFDPMHAKARGMKLKHWQFLLGMSLGSTLIVATKIIGALPTFAFIILPATAGLMLFSRLFMATIYAIIGAIVISWGGYILAFYADLPAGATIVCSLFILLLPGFLLKILR